MEGALRNPPCWLNRTIKNNAACNRFWPIEQQQLVSKPIEKEKKEGEEKVYFHRWILGRKCTIHDKITKSPFCSQWYNLFRQGSSLGAIANVWKVGGEQGINKHSEYFF